MSQAIGILVFSVAEHKLALELDCVERVLRTASLRRIPGAPETVLGLLDLGGLPIPIVSLRKKLKLADREMDTNDEIVIIKSNGSYLGLLVDEVDDVVQVENIHKIPVGAGLGHVSSALKLGEDIVLVHDIDRFLTSEEIMSANTQTAGH